MAQATCCTDDANDAGQQNDMDYTYIDIYIYIYVYLYKYVHVFYISFMHV